MNEILTEQQRMEQLQSSLDSVNSMGAEMFEQSYMAMMMGTIVVSAIILIVMAIITIIPLWRMFKKAGEAGWKTLIPVYNGYILFKIAGIKNMFWAFLVSSIVYSIGNAISGGFGIVLMIIAFIALLFVVSKLASKLSQAFGKSSGFATGLFFLPIIFYYILAFGSSEYVGSKE